MRTFLRSPLRTLATVATLALVCGTALADEYDYTIGSDARAFAMGGVGLATTRNQTDRERSFNPANLAYAPKSLSLYTPSLSFRADGPTPAGSAYDYLVNGADSNTSTDLIRKYSKEDSVFGLNGNIGFRVGALEILVQGTGKARLLPNAALSRWANSGQSSANIPLNAQADLLAAGYLTLPSIGYAVKIPMGATKEDAKKGYDASVGMRVRVIQAYYTRYFANQSILQNNTESTKAPELGGSDYLKKTGVGADLGFLFKPRVGKGINGAIVISNLIKPNAKFRASNVGLIGYQGRISNGEEFDILQTTVSLGTAYESGGLTLGADLMDISSATRPADLRLGGEQKIGKILALRGGYSSNTGITFGAGVFGVDVAFGERLPLEVNKSIRF